MTFAPFVLESLIKFHLHISLNRWEVFNRIMVLYLRSKFPVSFPHFCHNYWPISAWPLHRLQGIRLLNINGIDSDVHVHTSSYGHTLIVCTYQSICEILELFYCDLREHFRIIYKHSWCISWEEYATGRKRTIHIKGRSRCRGYDVLLKRPKLNNSDRSCECASAQCLST